MCHAYSKSNEVLDNWIATFKSKLQEKHWKKSSTILQPYDLILSDLMFQAGLLLSSGFPRQHAIIGRGHWTRLHEPLQAPRCFGAKMLPHAMQALFFPPSPLVSWRPASHPRSHDPTIRRVHRSGGINLLSLWNLACVVASLGSSAALGCFKCKVARSFAWVQPPFHWDPWQVPANWESSNLPNLQKGCKEESLTYTCKGKHWNNWMQEFLVLWWNFNRFTTWILDPCHFFTIIQQRLTNCSEVLRKWIADKSAFRVNTELSSQHIPNLNQFAPYPVVFHKPKISQKKMVSCNFSGASTEQKISDFFDVNKPYGKTQA